MAQFNDFAILCGKSKQCIHAPGSRYFREVIESNVEQYQQAPDKFSKMKVTKEIYDNLKVRYRFLKHNESTDSWEELTGLQARDKVRFP